MKTLLTTLTILLVLNTNSIFAQNTNQPAIKELTDGEIKQVGLVLCSFIVLSSIKSFSSEDFKKIICINLDCNINDKNINVIISLFLNKYGDRLICPEDSTYEDHREKQLYKHAILYGINSLFEEMLLDDEKYNIDFNMYEIVDGKKETILDYMDKLIASGKYDKDTLGIIQMEIEDLGGKRGAELDD